MGSSVNRQQSTVNSSLSAVNGFRDLIGQARAVRFLQRALMTGRIAHAYLFTGPEGVGKRAAALALARALNCEAGARCEVRGAGFNDACGVCRSCRKIAGGLHPDVQVIEPDGATVKIEQIRALEAEAALAPYEAKWKVSILDSAERMTEQAANALLKTLEEPPRDTVFILLASAVSALLPTIVSRCQTVTFFPLPRTQVEAVLVGKGMDQSQAHLIASLSHGSIGYALGPEVASLPTTRDRLLEELGRGLQDGSAALVGLAEKLGKDREQLQQHLELLAAWLRDLMVAKASGRREWLVNNDRGEEVARRAAGVTLDAILDGLRAVHAAMDQLTRNANARLSIEALLLRLREVLSSGLLPVSA